VRFYTKCPQFLLNVTATNDAIEVVHIDIKVKWTE